MNIMNSPTTSIKLAVFLLFISAILSSLPVVFRLFSTVSNTVTLVNFIRQILDISWIIVAIFSIIVSWFLLQTKKWAYIVAIIIVSGSILIHLFVLLSRGYTEWLMFLLNIAIFVCLMEGRDHFKKNKLDPSLSQA